MAIDGHPKRFYWKHLRSDGVEIDTEVSLSRLEIDGTEVQVQAIVRDVSDMVKNTRALKNRENLVRVLVNSTEDTAILIDSALKIVELNNITAKRIGRNRKELIGSQVFDLMDQEMVSLRRDKIDKLLQTRRQVDYESHWNGRHFTTKMYPVLDQKGEIIQIALFEKDITEEGKVLESLRASEEKFQKAFYCNPLSVHITTFPEGHYIDVNPTFEKITGFTKEELIGKSVLKTDFYIQDSDRERLIQEIMKEGRLHDYEISFRVRSGDIRICRLFAEIYEVQGQKQLITLPMISRTKK
jgi:PAS domain S-box-containing protein